MTALQKLPALRRAIALLLLLSLLYLPASSDAANNIPLKITTIFTENDPATDTYLDLLKTWQEKTGLVVQDASFDQTEDWQTNVLLDFAAGNEADILFFSINTIESAFILDRVVSIHEINEAYPTLQLSEDNAIAEADGSVYAVPVRSVWAALYCNVDLFEAHQLSLPATWKDLELAIERLNTAGITPLAVSLRDSPSYIAEFCILASGSPQDHAARPAHNQPIPESWIHGLELIRSLDQLQAFPPNANVITNAQASQAFINKNAAMILESSAFANEIPPENMDTTVVIPFPACHPSAEPAVLGMTSMGFYITRSAWNDPARREGAINLLAYLTTESNADILAGHTFSGRLRTSLEEMLQRVPPFNTPLYASMLPAARFRWFSAIFTVAEGIIDPERLWKELMVMNPFFQE